MPEFPDFAAILGAYGSPVYVYDLDRVAQAAADLREALPHAVALYYSLKANPLPDLIRPLRAAGCRAEVSSEGEVAAALAAGWDASAMLYTGPAKTSSEVDSALSAGVRLFSAESARDLRRVGAAATARGTEAVCLLRVGLPSVGHSALRMSGSSAHFGTPLDDILAKPDDYLDVPGAVLTGLHFFSMSNARDEKSLLVQGLAAITAAARISRKSPLPVEILDLGGGFAAPYAAPGTRPVYRSFRPTVEQALDAEFPEWRDGKPTVCFESGRYLVADSGTLLCTATESKRSADRHYVLLDSGINHLGGMAGLGRVFPAAVSVPHADTGTGHSTTTPARVTLAGPLCTPADVLGRDVALDLSRLDGPVVIPNVGAYGLTASLLGFLSRPTPVEVVVQNGQVISASRLEIRREIVRGVQQ